MYYPIARQCLLDFVDTIPELATEIRAAVEAELAAASDAGDETGSTEEKPGELTEEEESASPSTSLETDYHAALKSQIADELGDTVERFASLCAAADVEGRLLSLAQKDMVFSQKCTVFSDAIDLSGKTVTLRADLDLPLVKNDDGSGFEVDLGDDTDLERFNATVESIRSMFEVQDVQNLLILAHNGSPGGKIEPSFSLKPFVALLEAELDMPVKFVDSVIGEAADEALAELRAPNDVDSEEEAEKRIILFENLRFHPEELIAEETEYVLSPIHI